MNGLQVATSTKQTYTRHFKQFRHFFSQAFPCLSGLGFSSSTMRPLLSRHNISVVVRSPEIRVSDKFLPPGCLRVELQVAARSQFNSACCLLKYHWPVIYSFCQMLPDWLPVDRVPFFFVCSPPGLKWGG